MAFTWRRNPRLYEINAWTWLGALSRRYQRPITLVSVPDEELDALAAWEIDAVWLMGVWERSPAGRQVALNHPALREEYSRALPDWTPDDVIGSPYAVRCYEVDPHLGGRDGLAALRARLNARGLGVVLDFVPNHVAIDHPWVDEAPACFIQGSANDIAGRPTAYFEGPGGVILAHGRDPYFPPWTDTAQLNAFHPTLRTRAASILMTIAGQCDGVRCDMAMLVTNRVFRQTWGDRAGQMPPTEFWDVVLPPVKAAYPGLAVMAEVYWGLEGLLQKQGFDYTYDKLLYDHLLEGPVAEVVAHLGSSVAYQERTIRFIENHDEMRATMAFGPGRDLMAAVLVTTLPGATLLHEGQMEGHLVRLPVQLGRRPVEAENSAVQLFYRMLMHETAHPVFREGRWRLRMLRPAWDGNNSHRDLIAYTWRHGEERRLVVVNYSALAAQGLVDLSGFELEGRRWKLVDGLHPGEAYERDGGEMAGMGLYVDLPPWTAHLFRFESLG